MSQVFCTSSNPDVIKWSRTSLNVSQERAASVLGISAEILDEIEIGVRSPTLTELRKFSDLYKRPIATFFLPAPPAVPTEPVDFRTRGGPLSRETLLSIRRARAVQGFIGQLEEPINQEFWTFSADAKHAAMSAREWLGLSEEIQTNIREPRDFFRWLVAQLNEKHIEVLVHKFPRTDAKAYCFAEFPQIIVISSNDEFLGSRVFSVLHELGHLSRGDSGICLVQENRGTIGQERFCDVFAANLLMPESLIHRLSGDRRGKELADSVDEMADQVKSSKTALLIRFAELNLISNNELIDKLGELRLRTPAQGRGSSSRMSNLVKESGLILSNLVFDAYKQDRIGPVSASKMLNVGPAYLDELGSRLGLM
jgi:Zn-dependent peptidase ImmA (M78 family)